MSDTLSGRERIEVLGRKRLEDTRDQLNLATLQRQEAQQDYRARAIPSPDGGFSFRNALRA
jgi:hypothetical protein